MSKKETSKKPTGRIKPEPPPPPPINDGGQAFPKLFSAQDRNPRGRTYTMKSIGGMSLRDWFAGMAVQAYSTQICKETGEWTVDMIAASCYRLADAMLKEREKE